MACVMYRKNHKAVPAPPELHFLTPSLIVSIDPTIFYHPLPQNLCLGSAAALDFL